MTSSPLVTIIIPCYNVEKYVAFCIDSIINQDYENWECVIINDGSTDNTLEILKSFESISPKIRLFNQKNAGLSATRNRGIDLAEGKFLFFLDSDDILDKSAIRTFVSSFENNDIITGITVSSKINKEAISKISQLYSPKEGEIFFVNNHFDVLIRTMESALTPVAQNRLYKREFIEKNNLRFKEGILHEDELWFFETMLLARNVKFIDKETYFYRTDNSDSITKNISDKNLNSYLDILETILEKYYINNTDNLTKAVAARYLQYLKKLVIDFAIREKNRLSDVSRIKLEETLKKTHTKSDNFSLLTHKNETYYKALNKLSLFPFQTIEKHFFRNPINSIRKQYKLLIINFFLIIE
ncbi:glycosyltransferase [Epilithonimonas arachidiradicis]|uniref:Glycosyl transferase n=1 Tax=Epilithonimonas arachidiradicis TaxID=1617282 RepID=A0A420D803_9FLAO|nr:glycosyltransferase [Epilithonimonas arachidiradicis]RKE86829.1 glycosyltransferase involved in cell wall biosynthesis [Epilithonimonas arachidiradicis]GGG61687.1 glycosyl transferase [Epilithonimonas arachidiradicis]